MPSERAIIDVKRQAAADCRVRHAMTVIVEDSTDSSLKDNGLAEVPVSEIEGVTRTFNFALTELYPKGIGSKHPIFPLHVAHAAGQLTGGQVGLDRQTPHQRQKGRAFGKTLAVFGEHEQYLSKRTSRLQERWSDLLFLGAADGLSLYVGAALGVVRRRSLRRRLVEGRADA